MGKVIRITESQLKRIIENTISEQSSQPFQLQISKEVIDWINKNKVFNGEYEVLDTMNGEVLYINLPRKSYLGGLYSKSNATIQKIPKPKNLTKTNGNWVFKNNLLILN